MVFSKGGKNIGDKFKYVVNNSELEYVTSYKYLGINISNTGKFELAEKNLSLKASRALFSVKQSIFNNDVKPSVILKNFDSLVKPIALYGSEDGLDIKDVSTRKHLKRCLKCRLKAILNLIKLIQGSANLF